MKEDKEADPEDAERAKQQAIKNPEAENRQVKSAGEEAVGADQEHVKDDKAHMEELQKQTAQESQKEKDGKK